MADVGLELPLIDFDELFHDTVAYSSLIPTDECFCSYLQEQKSVEKSPFHESDSGVSDLSGKSPPQECRGKSPPQDDIPMLDEMLNDPTGPFLLGESGMFSSQDEDLARDMQDGNLCEQTNGRNIPEADSFQQDFRRTTRSQSATVGKKPVSGSSLDNGFQTPECSKFADAHSVINTLEKPNCCGSDSDVDIDRDVFVGKRKGSIRVKRAGAKLPSVTSSDKCSVTGAKLPSATSSDKCSVTSVKVLRIVNSGSDHNTEDEVAKALEERNRKNAEMARQNRLKKKEYVGNLEQEVEDGRKRIHELESVMNKVVEERDSYRREVEYLKSVLANQSALAGLLKNIPHVGGVTLSSSVSRKRNAELDHSYTPMKKVRHTEPLQCGSGVCLHVDSNNVSLEFCHHCADMANRVSTS